MAATEFTKTTYTAMGRDYPAILGAAVTAATQAKEQMGASAVCVALYITKVGPAALSTKLKSSRTAKTLLTANSITLPATLMNRFNATITALEQDVKKESARAGEENESSPGKRARR